MRYAKTTACAAGAGAAFALVGALRTRARRRKLVGQVVLITGVEAMIDAVGAHFGQIDILVNNAGEIMVSPFENLDIEDFERAMAVMFWGTVYTTLAVLPSMKMRGQGRIVNVTSIGGKVSVPHLLSYSCAKAAAVAFSNGLRNEIRQFGIDVTTIPGLMRTGSHVNAYSREIMWRKPVGSAWLSACPC